MARPTLKLHKPAAATASTRAPTSRAIRAMRGQRRPGATAAAATPASQPAAPPEAASAPASKPSARERGAATTPSTSPEAKRSRTRTKSGAAQRAARDARKAGGAGEAHRAKDGGATPRKPKPPSAGARESTSSWQRPHERRRGGGPASIEPLRNEAPRAAAATPARRAQPDLPRLSKRMAELGLCSRREADDWIENGWVRVDGEVVDKLGTRVSPDARITVDPAAARHQGELVTILLHKPVGYVSGQAEDGYRPASVLITPENRWPGDPSRKSFEPRHLRGLAPAGRLDIDSTGLIVFTQDGRVARRLVGRDSEVEKEYLVRVEGALSPEGLQRLRHGLELDGVKLRPAKVSWQNEDQLRFVLREGRKRQIRRMCELVGLAVVGLKRVRTGSVALGALPVGQWRYLRPDERF